MKPGSNENVDYILINLVPHTTQAPCFQKATQHRQLYSAAGRNKNEIKISHAFTFNTQSFKKQGSGVYLYFSLIRMLFFTLLIISLNSLPILLSNFKGNGLSIYGESSLAKSIMKISLGNQRHQEYERVLVDDSVKIDLFVSQTTVILVDIANTFIFVCFLIFWRIKSQKTIEQLISQLALPSYYTVEVKPLPPNYSQDSLKMHFRKLGAEVSQISTVFDYENVLSEVKKLIKLVDSFVSSSQKNKQKLYEQISLQLQKVRLLTKQKTPKPTLAIVTFEDMIMKKKIKDIYKYKICPRQLKYEGRLPNVQSCDVQPASILWQNYHLKQKVQIRQSILISFTLVCVLFAALLALFLVNAHATSMVQKQQSISKNFDYKRQYTYQQAKQADTLEALFVFCSKLNYHNFDFEFYYFCQPYFSAYKQRFQGMIYASLIVVGINLILNTTICKLANIRRYKTKTQKSRFLILNIFALSFINGGLLMLLIRLDLGGYSLGKLVSSVVNLPEDQFSIQAYSDFDRKWYVNVGSQIVMIHAVSLFTSPFIQILVNFLMAKIRAFKAKRAKTQYQMNQTLMDNQFDFQTFYAMILNACFFTMFHANAIPLLYVLALGAFFSIYIASFIVFKYFSCKPTMFDHSLNAVISKVMCVALIMHQITSILYFYTQDIFPLNFDHPSGHNMTQGQRFNNKLKQSAAYAVILVLLIVFTTKYTKVCKIIKKKFHIYFYSESEKVKQPKLFSQIFRASDTNSINTQQLATNNRKSDYLSSYKMDQNPNYANICYALKILSIFEPYFSVTSEVPIQKRPTKFTEMMNDQQAEYNKAMTDRPLNSFHDQV